MTRVYRKYFSIINASLSIQYNNELKFFQTVYEKIKGVFTKIKIRTPKQFI